VKEYVLPELDDEFAKDVGEDFTTIEDLKNHIRESRKKEKENSLMGDTTDKIMLKLLENHKFDVPGRLVGYEVSALIKEMEDNLMGRGMTLESAGLNRDNLIEQYREAAERRVRGDFILKKIGEAENIKLENSDIDAGFKRISERYNMPVSEVKKYFQKRDDLLPFMNELLSEKILAFLRTEAKITKVAPEAAPTDNFGGQA
jgi:trigger factor